MQLVLSFGAWVGQRRHALRLTQQEVARLVGCSPILIRKIEADERRPSAATAERLARAAGPARHDPGLRPRRARRARGRPPAAARRWRRAGAHRRELR